MRFNLHDEIKLQVAKILSESISELLAQKKIDPQWAPNIEDVYSAITDAPNLEMGHKAYPCFTLSKMLKASPAQIAKELEAILAQEQYDLVEKFVATGPYVNLFFQVGELAEKTLPHIIDGSFFTRKLFSDAPKTMIEFSQPNTHKEMHVGHMRNLCLGDALVKLHSYSGFPIKTSTFPGDVGTHVAKCLWYLKFHNKESAPETRKGAWLGQMYSKGHNLLEDQKGTPQEEKNREQLTLILKQIEAKQGEYYDLWKQTREWSIEQMKDVYQWANVTFDHWYWESEVDSDSLKLARDYFAKGLFVEDQGAIGIDLKEFGLGFCLLIKSDGNGLYATKDLELARKKFEAGIEKSVYIVDKRQAHHFAQVFKVLELMGFENAKNCYHLQYDYVELPDGAMSSRKGNIVPLQSLVENMASTIEKDYLEKYRGQWSDDEIDLVANQVARGAIKFGMNRIDPTKKIVFDMKEWLKLDGESGPYIQYVCARIHSLLAKLDFNYKSEKVSGDALKAAQETSLLLKLIEFNNVVEQSTLHYKTNTLCSYLYDLGKLFNSFYAECSVAHAENKATALVRAQLCYSVALVMKKGLNLLGAEVPARM